MLARLENMVLMGMDLPLTAIRNQIASGVDVIVHLGRIRDKSRRVLEITEVVGCENGEIRLNPLYQFEELGKTVKEKWSAGCGEKENYFMKESLRQQDYHKVFQKRGDCIRLLAQTSGVVIFFAWFFYRSIWAVPLLFPLGILYFRRCSQQTVSEEQTGTDHAIQGMHLVCGKFSEKRICVGKCFSGKPGGYTNVVW